MNKSVKSVLCSRLCATLIIAAGTVCASTVKVSDFGFDPEDSTKFLQKALSSSARKIVIDKQSSPWIVRPVRLRRNNVEIVFEPGVEVVAKKGAYQYYGDCLFRAHGIKNLRIIGNGATLRMQRADYIKAPYKRSEHRHGLDFSDVHGLYIENLNIVSTGGDAIYLGGSPNGGCVDVTIRGVKTADNHRQGLSVISAENLLVADCVFETTCSTPPMDAIDFEPNQPGQRIVNCVVSNCVARGNLGFAWDVAVNHLNSKARPISVEFIDCIDEGNNGSLRIFCENRDFDNVKGSVKFRRCKFIRPRVNTFSVTQNADFPVSIEFEDCSYTPRDADKATDVPDWRKLCLSPEITGSDSVVAAQTEVDFSNAAVSDLTPGQMATFSPMAIRYGCAYLFYADRAKTVRFRGIQTPIGRNVAPSDQPMQVSSIDGKTVASFPMPGFGEKDFEVNVPGAGFYRLEVVAQRSSYALTGCDVPVALDLYRGRRSMINSAGAFYINVAEGSMPVAVTAVGSATERLRVKLTDPSGAVAWDRDRIDRTCRHVVENPAAGIWKMQILKATKGSFEDYKIDLTGVPSHLFLSKDKTWRIVKVR
jgi:hypothetical protein